MASVVSEILQDLVETLRDTDMFRLATLGEQGSAVDVPRVALVYEGQESLQPDDSAESRWVSLVASVIIRTRSGNASQAVIRINELCDEAIAALLDDPYRGNRCHDLPVGMATEVGRARLTGGLKRPEVEMTFDIRCHFEVEDSE